jgi:hypothetical protein
MMTDDFLSASCTTIGRIWKFVTVPRTQAPHRRSPPKRQRRSSMSTCVRPPVRTSGCSSLRRPHDRHKIPPNTEPINENKEDTTSSVSPYTSTPYHSKIDTIIVRSSRNPFYLLLFLAGCGLLVRVVALLQ